jgi:hypothetical protein
VVSLRVVNIVLLPVSAGFALVLALRLASTPPRSTSCGKPPQSSSAQHWASPWCSRAGHAVCGAGASFSLRPSSGWRRRSGLADMTLWAPSFRVWFGRLSAYLSILLRASSVVGPRSVGTHSDNSEGFR